MHEQFANEFFYLTNDLLCVLGVDGFFKDVNPAWTRTLGWSREELLSRPYIEFVHPDDRTSTNVAYDEANQTQGTRRFENRYLCKDGSYRWLRWGGAFKQEAHAMWGLAQDVTLIRQETHHQTALIDSLSEGFTVRDNAGNLLAFNQLALEILDLTEEELRARSLKDPVWGLLDEEGRSLDGEQHPSMVALATGKTSKKILGITVSNNEIRWVRVSSVPIFSNLNSKPEQVLSMFQDITEQITTQKRLEIAVRSGKFGIWEWNIRNQQVYWDHFMYEIYGVDREQTGDHRETVLQLILDEDRPFLVDAVQKAFDTQSDFSSEFRIRRLDGKLRIIRTESKGFYDEKGRAIRHVGVCWDVTEQREQELKLMHASKMSSLGEISAGIAHEINNPLAIIMGKNHQLRSMLDRKKFDEALLQRNVETIDHTGKRIAKIIKGLRSFARDGIDDPFERCSVDLIVEDVLSFFSERFHQQGVKFELKEVQGLSIEARASQIMQVLINLLNNAFDAIESLPERWIALEVNDEGSWISFSVIDSGSGIQPEIRDKILQPFFTTKQIGKGTGLGLSISGGLVKSHGGTLEIDVMNPHTCFVVRLPKVQPALHSKG